MKSPTTPEGSLGQRLFQARRAAGLSRSELAQQLRVDMSTIRHWEWGRYNPRNIIFTELIENFITRVNHEQQADPLDPR